MTSPNIHVPKNKIIKPEDISLDDLQALSTDSFALWALTSGVKVDHKDVDFNDHRWLLPIYMDDSKVIAWQKAAQMGATVYMLLRILWWLSNNPGCKAGLYMPNKELVENTSKDRLSPLISSCKSLETLVDDSDKLGLKKVGTSSFYLFHLGGLSSKDSVPLDYISFDEVRLCSPKDIDQALERISGSKHRYRVYMSTAGIPDCFSGDTNIIVRKRETSLVTKKSFRELQDCYEDYEVLSYNRLGGYRPRWRDIKAVINRGPRQLHTVTLEGGHKVHCTENHRFAVSGPGYPLFGKGSFVPVNEISKQEKASHQPHHTNVFALNEIPTHEGITYNLATMELFGLYIAEGSFSSGTLSIWQNDAKEGKHRQVRDLVAEWADSNGLPYYENDRGIHVSDLKSRPDLVRLLKECGPSAAAKKIPGYLLKGNKAQLVSLLHGFILGDGHVRAESNLSTRKFDLYTSSEALAKDLLFLGMKIGTPFSISERDRRGEEVVVHGKKTGYCQHKSYQLSYTENSHRSHELLRGVGGAAVRSIEPYKTEDAFDITVDQDSWFFLADSGALVHNSDINARFLDGTQHVWRAKCFALDQKLVVRRKTSKKVSESPELKTLLELRDDWNEYQALSCDTQHKRLQYQDITAFYDNGAAEVVEVLFDDGSTVVCTPDHEFAWHNGKPVGEGGRTSFAAISELQRDYRYDKNNLLAARTFATEQFEVQLPYDLMTFYAIGAYAAEGSWPNSTTIEFSQLRGKKLWHKVQEWAEQHNLYYNASDKSVRVSLHTRPDLMSLFQSLGKGCDKKTLGPLVPLGSTVQLGKLLEGYLDGDGHRKPSGYWEATTTSEVLSRELQFVAMRVGYSTRRKKERVKEGRKPAWSISYSSNVRRESNPLSNHIGTAKMVEIRSLGKARVADIEVAKNHNYVLHNGFIAHNCGCSDGVSLARSFPDCVVEDKKRNKLYLRCPKCKWEIKDPQNGRYVPNNPGADYNSYHASQLVSRLPLHEVWNMWKRTTNLEEFYNAKLGLPYIDEANRGVSMEQCKAAVNDDLTWGLGESRNHCAMGVDQGAGYCMAVIADMDDGKKRIRHVEIIEQGNPDYMENGKRVSPFKRLHELMREFNVRICVVDAMPNMNDALGFAQEHPGRVFLAYYQRDSKDVVQWGDKTKYKQTIVKAGPLLKFKYTCVLGRFPSLSVALGSWAGGGVVCPDPNRIRQMCVNEKTGLLAPESPCERMFSHLCRLIKRFHVTNEETGEGRHEWIFSSQDPHLAHAWNYCNVALERLQRQVIFTFA